MLRGVLWLSLFLIALSVLFCIAGLGLARIVDRPQVAYAGEIGVLHLADVTLNLRVQLIEGINDIPPTFNWSPDGQSLLYTLLNEGIYDLYLITLPEMTVRPLPFSLPSGILPQWSPDSQTMVFESETSDVCIYPLQDDRIRCLGLTGVSSPVWSPAGDEITYITSDSIRAINLADQSTRVIAQTPVLTRSLHWSPDGQSLLYRADSNTEGVSDLFQIEISTGAVRNLTNSTAGYIFGVVYSPDSNRIVFISQQRLSFDVYVYDFIRERLQNITDNTAYEGSADWADNSQYLVYVSDRAGLLGVYIQRGVRNEYIRFVDIAVSYNAAWRPMG